MEDILKKRMGRRDTGDTRGGRVKQRTEQIEKKDKYKLHLGHGRGEGRQRNMGTSEGKGRWGRMGKGERTERAKQEKEDR